MKKIIMVLFFSICCLYRLVAADPQEAQKEQPKAANNGLQAAGEQASKQLTDDEAFRQKINDLINKRRQLSMSIYQTRVNLIETDPNLRILHQAIMDLHQKMAAQLNDNPRIVTLIDKGKEMDKEIAQTIQDYQQKKRSK